MYICLFAIMCYMHSSKKELSLLICEIYEVFTNIFAVFLDSTALLKSTRITRQILALWTPLTETRLFYVVYDVKNYNYIFKKKMTKIDVNLQVSSAMFIGTRDVIGHVIPYPGKVYTVNRETAQITKNIFS